MKHPTVALIRCREYHVDTVLEAVRQAAEAAGGIDLRGKRVLLKPNILRDTQADKAVTTHPVFVRACVAWAKEKGAREVLVGDSPAFQPPGYSGRRSGIRQATEEAGAEWVDFSGDKRLREVPHPLAEGGFHFTAAADEADCIISLPKLKTHQLMYYTGAMKNLFGLVPGLAKSSYHVRFSSREEFGKMIADLAEAAAADFALMDAVTAMEGPGPGSGTPRKVGLVAASSDLLAMDIILSGVIGYEPAAVPSNRWGMEKPGAVSSPDEIEVRGLTREEARVPNFEIIRGGGEAASLVSIVTRWPFVRRLEIRLRAKPRFHHDRCIRCGECVRVCAAGALEMRKDRSGTNFVHVDYGTCIRCYCCHEVCPADAISVGKKAARRRMQQ
jgi:uncharacterized protein (DUF362 family)/NAD-dependent dihydropyrimidine dehydrogenase PreA subunit